MCALTSSSVNALPLKSEPIALWSKSSDLYSFLCDLYDDDGEIIDQSGVRSAVNYRDYGDTLFERGKSSFVPMASEFQTIAEKNRAEPDPFGTPIQIDSPPNFLEDPSFGLMAKHSIAWAAATEALLSDFRFFSLPHILEAVGATDCRGGSSLSSSTSRAVLGMTIGRRTAFNMTNYFNLDVIR